MLQGKKIIVAVTGSIAAYKAAMLVRLLVKLGAEVQVLMTHAAKDFITPLTLATLSKKPVLCDYFEPNSGEWNNHVALGLWADVMIVAPASANTLAKMANGGCDNLVLATYLSAKCPVFIAPAMDLDMYNHPSTQQNLNKLMSYGNYLIKPNHGELASGLVGEGRLAEPEEMTAILDAHFRINNRLKGKRVLVTAGPTYENIDPVRFIGNHSTGKMGFAIAEALVMQGAEVELITGPTSLIASHPFIKQTNVISAADMYKAVMDVYKQCDVVIMSAAVADYTPNEVAEQKIKKKTNTFEIVLKPTIDILAELGSKKQPQQTLIGFALETENELENAQEKLQRKNLDYIVLNSLNNSGAGFKHDTNRITIIGKDNKITRFELKSKAEVAQDIIETCLI